MSEKSLELGGTFQGVKACTWSEIKRRSERKFISFPIIKI